MKDRSKEVFFPLFALFVIFSDELFYSIMYILDIPVKSGMKGRVAMVIAGVAYIMMATDFARNKFVQKNKIQFAVLFILLALYFMTGFFYSQENSNYNVALLVYGALCIPATYVGMRLARGGYEDAMLRYLPYYLIAVALIVGYTVINGFAEGRMLGVGDKQDNGLNYQNASYFMSFCCAYSIFYVFFMKGERRNMWNKLLYRAVFLLIFLCAVGTIVGGGRGAFVYLVIVSAYLVYRIMGLGKGVSKMYYLFMLAVAIIVMGYLATRFGIFDSAGATRVYESLMVDYERKKLSELAMASFFESPIIGHGIGSIWWEVGFYSHNIILDSLVEMGILGTIIMVAVLIKMLVRLVRISKNSNFDMFMLLLFGGQMLQGTFSGYWFSSFCLFIVFGYVYGKSKEKRHLDINYKKK